jgi:hypothetical protein
MLRSSDLDATTTEVMIVVTYFVPSIQRTSMTVKEPTGLSIGLHMQMT